MHGENCNVTRQAPFVPAACLAALVVVAGCSSLDESSADAKVDYRNGVVKTKPLDVPPDLTQIARESRYASQGGVVSAAAGPASAASPARPSNIAPSAIGDIKVERDGNQRWLSVPQPPEKLWPQLRGFWQDRGFAIAYENAEAGVIETEWAENRVKMPQDLIRSAVGRVLGNLIDTGERDRYRMRVERTAAGSEIFISHRGLVEVYSSDRREGTEWKARPSDPQLEAELMSLLMVKLAGGSLAIEPARTAVANAPEVPARARAVAGSAALEVDEPFDRAWRRVGLALDRGGFTVEDRDRAGGLYFVRYVDPKNAGKEEPGWWDRLFSGNTGPRGPLRYRIAVKGSGTKTVVSVLNSTGEPEAGENAQRIVGQLVNELR